MRKQKKLLMEELELDYKNELIGIVECLNSEKIDTVISFAKYLLNKQERGVIDDL